MTRDRYYKAPDGYDAYQWRELLKREIKDGKVYSTYKCSNMGGEVDMFTTVFPVEVEKSSLDKVLDSIENHWILIILIPSFIFTMIAIISLFLFLK